MNNKKIFITIIVSAVIISLVTVTTKIEKREMSFAREKISTENSSKNDNNQKDTSEEGISNNETKSGDDNTYKDGEYEGIGKGFKGDVKVKVKISSGKIENIDVVSNIDDYEYFIKAKEIIKDIISSQSTDVNVVSGATFSSNGILDAVDDALSKGGSDE